MAPKTFAQLKNEEKEKEERLLKLFTGNNWHLRQKLVLECLKDPEKQLDPQVLLYERFARNEPLDMLTIPHRCYWNCRFAEAVICCFSLDIQRRAADHLLKNSSAGYFEKTTHATYKMVDVFALLGLEFSEDDDVEKGVEPLYFKLKRDFELKLKLMFQVRGENPTTDLSAYSA